MSLAPATLARATDRTRPILVAILLLAAALRLLALDTPLYIDEIVTITVATQPLRQMGEVMRQIDASPALYPVLLHLWLHLGLADAWARALSALFGIFAVWVVYRLARRAFGDRTGLAAGFIAAIAPAHIHYAQYVRGYSLFTVLAGLYLWLALDWFTRSNTPSRARTVALTATTAALLYTHYLSLLALLAMGVYALGRARVAPRLASRWAGTQALALALFLPGTPLLLHNMAFDRVRNEARPAPPPVARLVPDLVGELSVGQRALGFSVPGVRRVTLAAAAVAFPALFIVGAARGWRENRQATVLLALFAVLPIATYVVTGRKLVAVRFFLPFMLGYLVLLGHGLASLRPRAAAAVATLLLTTICAIPLAHFYTTFEWSYDHRRAADEIEARLRPGDVLLFVHPYEAFYYRWYLGPSVPMKGLVFTALEDQGVYVIKPPAIRLETAQRRVVDAAADYERVWVIGQSQRSFASDPIEERRLLGWMDERFGAAESLDALTSGHAIVRLYRTGRRR